MCNTWSSQEGAELGETVAVSIIYRMAGNFGGKIFWRIAENMSFDGIYFGG